MTTDGVLCGNPPGLEAADPNPRQLCALALRQGAGIDVLERLTALAERWDANEAKKQFAVAMNACQAEMPTIVRDKRNTETNKLYAPLETVKTWSKPHFIKHGFSLAFTGEPGADPTLVTTHLDVTHTGGHTQRTTLPNVPWDTKGPKGGAVKTDVQGLMSSMSYAQGRLICLAFNLTVADEDRDGQASTISPDQVGLINDAIAACEGADRWFPDSLTKLCRVYEIDSLDQLPAARLRDVLADLDRQATGRVGGRK